MAQPHIDDAAATQGDARSLRRPPRRLWLLVVAVVVAALTAIAWWGYPQWQAYSHWRRAHDALAATNLVQARESFLACLKAWPKDAALQFQLARTCRRTGEYAEARSFLDAAEQCGHAAEDVALENLLLEAEAGDFPAVEETLKQHIQVLHRDEELILETLVRTYLHDQRLPDVDFWAKVWIERYPKAWLPQFYLAQALELVPKLDLAAKQYEKTLALKPDHLESEYRLGHVRLRLDQYDLALPHLKAAHQKSPNDPIFFVNLLRCLRAMGANEEALQRLEAWQALQTKDNPHVCVMRARLATDLGRADEAFSWYKRAEQLAPNDEEAIRGLETLLREQGDQEEADRYKRRGDDVHERLKRLDSLTQKIRDNPDNPIWRVEAGEVLLSLGHDRIGLRWLTSVLVIDENHREAHLALAKYYDGKGDGGRANEHRQAAEGKLKTRVQIGPR